MNRTGTNSTIGGGGFHHVAVKAFDFEASMKFYCEGMGFVRKFGWGKDERGTGGKDSRGALLDSGDGNYVELFGGGIQRSPEKEADSAVLHFAFRSSNVDEAHAHAIAAGATDMIPPKTVPIDGDTATEFRVAFVKGPDGEVIEFFDNPFL